MEGLTRAQILSEVPGRQLDEWVARYIMTVPRLYLYRQAKAENDAYYKMEFAQEELAVRDHALSLETPLYSMDICNAWKIIEELNSRGLPMTLEIGKQGQVRVCIGNSSEGQVRPIFDDQDYLCTVPEAICKAALLTCFPD